MSVTAPNVLTQYAVEDAGEQLRANLETATYLLADTARTLALAEVAFKRAYAMAYARLTGPVEERKQSATLECITEFEAWKLADAVHGSQQELLRTMRAEMDWLRTISANIRAQT
jgi:hypothetical protein